MKETASVGEISFEIWKAECEVCTKVPKSFEENRLSSFLGS